VAVKTFYLTATVSSGAGLDQGWRTLSETAQTAANNSDGWVVGTGASNDSEYNVNTIRASTTFVGTTVPDGTLDQSLKDAFRSTNPLNGAFVTANWTFNFVVRGSTQAGTQAGRIRFRVIRANADGSGGTEITSGIQTASTVTITSTGTDFTSSLTVSVPGASYANQYLFIQLAWERTAAGGMTTTDVVWRTGSSSSLGTRIVTADFTAAQLLTGSSVGVMDDYSGPAGVTLPDTTNQVSSTLSAGQTFTGNGQAVQSVAFFIYRDGLATGNVRFAIYATSSGLPTGTALDSVTMSVSPFQPGGLSASEWVTGRLSGTVVLTNGVTYAAVVESVTLSGGSVFLGTLAAGAHAGKAVSFNGSTWSNPGGGAQDTLFVAGFRTTSLNAPTITPPVATVTTATIASGNTRFAPTMAGAGGGGGGTATVLKVQVKTIGQSSDTTTITLDSTPTVGNLLWAYVHYFPDVNYHSTPPAGWTTERDTRTGPASYLAVYSRVVQSGDGTSYTWNFDYLGSPNAQGNIIILYEFSGADPTTPLDGGSVTGFTSDTTPDGTSVTPSKAGCKPISVIQTDGWQTTSLASSDGTTFTKDVDQGAGGDLGAALGTLSTTAAINCHWNIDVALSGKVTVDLIRPATTGAADQAVTGANCSSGVTVYTPTVALASGSQSVTSGTVASSTVLYGPTVSIVWKFLGHVTVQGDGGTTPSLDTTGADLIVVHGAYKHGTYLLITDNKGNTWFPTSAQFVTSTIATAFRWCQPTGSGRGAGHTFSVESPGGGPVIHVFAFKGAATTPWKTFTDLRTHPSFGNLVASASHPFSSADVGNVIHITGGSGWTPGYWTINGTSSVGGVIYVTLGNIIGGGGDPASAGVTGGIGELGAVFESTGGASGSSITSLPVPWLTPRDVNGLILGGYAKGTSSGDVTGSGGFPAANTFTTPYSATAPDMGGGAGYVIDPARTTIETQWDFTAAATVAGINVAFRSESQFSVTTGTIGRAAGESLLEDGDNVLLEDGSVLLLELWGGVAQVFAPSVTTSDAVITGTIVSGSTPNAPTITVGAVAVTGATRASTLQLFAPSVAPGAVTIAGATRPTTLQLFAPVLTGLVTGATIPTGNQRFAPTVVQNVTNGTITSTVQIAAPTVGQTVSTSHRPSGLQLNAPSLSVGAVSITLPTIASSHQLFALSVSAGAVTVVGGPIVAGTTLFPPTITGVSVGGIGGGTVATTSQVFQPSIVGGLLIIVTPTIASASTVTPPNVAPGAVTVIGGTRPSTLQVFAPLVTPGAVEVLGSTCPTTEQLHAPTLTATLVGGTIASGSGTDAPSVSPVVMLPLMSVFTRIYAPTVIPPVVLVVEVSTIPSEAVMNGPELEVGAITISGGTIAGTELFPPIISGGITPGTCLTGCLKVRFLMMSGGLTCRTLVDGAIKCRPLVKADMLTISCRKMEPV